MVLSRRLVSSLVTRGTGHLRTHTAHGENLMQVLRRKFKLFELFRITFQIVDQIVLTVVLVTGCPRAI